MRGLMTHQDTKNKKPTWASDRSFLGSVSVRRPGRTPHIRAFTRSTVAAPGPVGRALSAVASSPFLMQKINLRIFLRCVQ